MVPGISALLEDGYAGRQDHNTEAIENAGIAGFVDRLDDGVGTLDIDRDPGVWRDVDPLRLKQETPDGHGALHRDGIFPNRLAAVGLQRPTRRPGVRAPRWRR